MKRFLSLLILAIAPLSATELAHIFSPGTPILEQSKAELIRKFYDAFEKNDAAALSSTLLPKYTVRNLSDLHQSVISRYSEGSSNLVERMKAYHEAFPNLTIKIEEMFGTENKIVAVVSMTGIQKGNFLGIAPTNRYITAMGVAIFTITSDKISEIDEMVNEYQLMKQLGYIAI